MLTDLVKRLGGALEEKKDAELEKMRAERDKLAAESALR